MMDEKIEERWNIVLDNLTLDDIELIKKKINKILINKFEQEL